MSTKKKPVADARVMDGWLNVLTGLGDLQKDKREGGVPTVDLISYGGLGSLYRGADLAARIVDLPAEEMTRQGFDVRIEDDEETAEELGAALDDLDCEAVLLQALKWLRLYGGSVILVGANDGSTTLSTPLNEANIQSVDFLTPFDAYEARPTAWQENPAKKDFGKPTVYQLNPQGMASVPLEVLQNVHASRVLSFVGPIASRQQIRASGNGIHVGWGDSVLLKCAKLIRDYDQSWGGVSALLQDFAQTVYKISGLAESLMADKDQSIKKRMQIIDMSRSMIRAVLLDKDNEDFQRTTASMSGVPETMTQFAQRLAAAAEMPVTVLYGQSPAGLGATGASDIRFFYDKIAAMQRRTLKREVERLVKYLLLAKNGPTKGKEPGNYQVKFRSLWQLDDEQTANVRNKNAQTDKVYVDMGVASAEDVAESRFGGDEYGMDLVVDMGALEDREELAAEVRDVTRVAAIEGLENPPEPAPGKQPAPPTKKV